MKFRGIRDFTNIHHSNLAKTGLENDKRLIFEKVKLLKQRNNGNKKTELIDANSVFERLKLVR